MGLTILFGSGADTDYCCKLKSGAAFNEALLTGKFTEERKVLLSSDSIAKQHNLINHNNTTLFVQTIVQNETAAKEIFCEDDVKKCKKYYDGDFVNKPKDTDTVKQEKELKREFVKKLCKYCYYVLKNNDMETSKYKESDFPEPQEIKEFFLSKAVFFDTLDEKFNSLRNIQYNTNAKKVINAYATVFILMMKTLYDLDGSFSWTYEDLFDKLSKDSEVFQCGKSKKTYYSIVKESGLDCNIVTTNYTDLAEKRTRKDVTYLHGNLKWFEDLQHLTIYDISNEDEKQKALENKEHLIPFILIPSGVKPLICQKQIKQFSTFIDNLEDSDELCVIGYRFNSEDNHVNSIIADWLRKDKKHHMIYFDYRKKQEKQPKEETKKQCDKVDFGKLAWAKEFEQKELDSDTINQIADIKRNYQIITIPINEDNACEKFEAYIKEKSKI